MKKIFIFILFLIYFLVPKNIYANDFLVEADVTYELNPEPYIKVVHEIRLENLTTENYAPSFTFNLSGLEIRQIRAFSEDIDLKVVTDSQDKITIEFPDALVGKNKFRNFTVEFIDRSLLTLNGEVWELALPKTFSNDDFDSYDVRLIVPNSFEKLAYISPEPISSFNSDASTIYYFQKENIQDTGVVAAIGDYQTYSYNLKYHLENPLLVSSKIDIAIPPDTPYQEIFLQDISPKPERIFTTEEGNWMATYKLKSRERVDVEVTGFVNIYSWPRFQQEFSKEYLDANLAEQDYWEVNDPEIKKLARELKTPEKIYDYVVSKLTYNYENVTPTNKRLGASQTLKNPDQAICNEFSDLFVTLARAAGIPARVVNGYAETDNPTLQPLSLVADVLHAWPEYYDFDKKVWVPVDPTWGNTTGGTDYFSKLDLRHFAFVFHGLSSSDPAPPGSYKLGSNPQKDVYISVSELPEFSENTLSIDINKKESFLFMPPKITIKVYNPGPNAIYAQSLKINSNFGEIYSKTVPILLPFNETHTEITLPYGLFGTDLPHKVFVNFAGGSQEIDTNRDSKIAKDVIAIFIFTVIITVAGILYTKKIK